METILIHEDIMNGGIFHDLCNMLKREGVKIYTGLNLANSKALDLLQRSLRREYGALECCIEIVKDIDKAVDCTHTCGSGHTDVIVTENVKFNNKLGSRFADGLRFGLGAELGISAGRILAHGPVGVGEFLQILKWSLRGKDDNEAGFTEEGQ
ncbi:unnamed protein product [Ceratitis capitata]|uniref:(Mediterranean fruit fly) hypothetical protein n=1 Tax=Ceratitis capitata TaxID=7213 RepID=A0A811UYP8_CERCA|nr:unnamed protein product [Ceratitis capitata]CAD7003165.1 unnamed protein product [Ceratitis capitata]